MSSCFNGTPTLPPLVDPVPSDQQLPNETEVAIIGGGIIGVSAALTLAERGIPVALFEKGHIAGEHSSRNWRSHYGARFTNALGVTLDSGNAEFFI